MDENQNQEWGVHAFLRGIILFGFTMLFLSLVISGNIVYYIAPKMMPFVYFALVTFFLLCVLQIIRSTPKGQQEEIECGCGTMHQMTGSLWKNIAIYSIFIFPLLTGFMFPDKVLDSSVTAIRGVQLGSGIYSKPEEESEKSDEIEHYKVEDTYSNDGFDDYYAKLAANVEMRK